MRFFPKKLQSEAEAGRARVSPPIAVPGPVRKVFVAVFAWFFPLLGFVLAFGITLSPWFVEQMDLLFESTVRVEAHIDGCDTRRNGQLRENVIRCSFSYTYKGQPFTSQGTAWSSDSDFLTRAGLEAALAAQLAQPQRQAAIRERRPAEARLVDTRWLVMPSLGLCLFIVVIAMLALLIYLEPSATVYRRADMVVDPETGELVEINANRSTRMRWLRALKTFTGLLVVASCLYGLSNRPGNAVAISGMRASGGLQPVPAQLAGCTHRLHGSYRGHDQIDCGFDYSFNGQALHGQAESLDFRNFPTRARMDAEVARIQSAAAAAPITAWVDPQRPAYAWAFISNDFWVPASWGLWELELWVVLIAALVFVLAPLLGKLRKPRPVKSALLSNQ